MAPLLATLIIPFIAAQAPFAQYEGTLPCADCQGIRTILVLEGTEPTASEGMFTLRETYLGASRPEVGRVIVTRGRWTIARRQEAGGIAVIYELTPDMPDRPRYFEQVDTDRLRALDAQRKPIASALDYTLRRTDAATAIGGFRPVDATSAEVTAAAEFAVRTQADRSRRRLTLLVIEWAERQIVAGTNFRLCLVVATDDGPGRASAIVYRSLDQRLSLTTWTTGACR